LTRQRAEGGVQVVIGGTDPVDRIGSAPEQARPATTTVALVERQPEADGVEPCPRIGPVEAIPSAESAQVGILREIERGLPIVRRRTSAG
jgi:hypothetical protein